MLAPRPDENIMSTRLAAASDQLSQMERVDPHADGAPAE